VIKSNEIEGEVLDKGPSSFIDSPGASGMDIGALTPASGNGEGVVEMMLDATQEVRHAPDRMNGYLAGMPLFSQPGGAV